MLKIIIPTIITIRPIAFFFFIRSLRKTIPNKDTHIYPEVSRIGPIDNGTPLYDNVVKKDDKKNKLYAIITNELKYSFKAFS